MVILRFSSHPRTIFLELLYGCNLYCSYCYIGQKRNHTKPIVPAFEVTQDILKKLKAENVDEIVLLGGEPMLHPRFTDICTAIAELDFPYRGVVTNGTAMTEQKALLLKHLGFWVDISFRGTDADTFDTIVGKKGAFWKAFNAALLLSRVDAPVGIEFDCIPQNYNTLFATIEMLIYDGVHIKQLQLHRIMPEGDAREKMDQFSLSLDQWRIVFEQAARIRETFGISVVFEDGFPLCLVKPEHRKMITPCPCGFTLLTVAPNGDVRYCPCHSETLGNIRCDSLAEIWQNSLTQFRSTTRHPPVCLTCDLFEVCRGGCSASGGKEMDEGVDVFQEEFRPIKIDTQEDSNTKEFKIIIGQNVCSII